MSVLVSIVGGKPDADVYRAAIKLKIIIQESVPQSVIGEIVQFLICKKSWTSLSKEAKVLKTLVDEYSDYITWI